MHKLILREELEVVVEELEVVVEELEVVVEGVQGVIEGLEEVIEGLEEVMEVLMLDTDNMVTTDIMAMVDTNLKHIAMKMDVTTYDIS